MRQNLLFLFAAVFMLLACTEQSYFKLDAGAEDVTKNDAADVPADGIEPEDAEVAEALNDVEMDPDIDGSEPTPEVETTDGVDIAEFVDTADTPETESPPEEAPEVVEDTVPETQDVEVAETEVVTPPSVLDHVGWFGGAPPATTESIEHVGSFGMSGGGLVPAQGAQ
jgi:hypothetical protein